MHSQFQLFENHWNNRNDFPLVLDIKYALMEIQSYVYSKDNIHPIFYTLCDTINKHEKSIVKKCLQHFEENAIDQYFFDVVNIYVFEAMLPNILKYIEFCQRNNMTFFLTNLPEPIGNVRLVDAIFYIWQIELPNRIWLPLNNNVIIDKYLNLFNTKIAPNNTLNH